MQKATLVDVSHIVEHGMITYKGLPAPIMGDYLSREASKAHYAEGTTFHIGKLEMVANTGTYVDAPFHRFLRRPSQGQGVWDMSSPSLRRSGAVIARPSAWKAGLAGFCVQGLGA